MTRLARWMLFLVLSGILAAGILMHFLPLAPNPEGEIIGRIKATESEGLRLSVPGTQEVLQSVRHRFDRITVSPNFSSGTATVVATLDFVGRVGNIQVSSLGWERMEFRQEGGAWLPKVSYAPVLSGIVAALANRRLALAQRDIARLRVLKAKDPEKEVLSTEAELERYLRMSQAEYQVSAWVIRSQREGATVGEDYRIVGYLSDHAVDERGHRRLTLVSGEGAFRFWPTLM